MSSNLNLVDFNSKPGATTTVCTYTVSTQRTAENLVVNLITIKKKHVLNYHTITVLHCTLQCKRFEL